MRKLTRKELRAIVLEVRKAGFELSKTYVLIDTFTRDGWYGLGLNFLDGKKSMRIVMPLKNKPTLDEVTKQLGKVYDDVRISEKPTEDFINHKEPVWVEGKAEDE